MKAGVIDAAKVTRSALQNAASIAALFLTTEAVVADKPEKRRAPAAMPGGMHGRHGRMGTSSPHRPEHDCDGAPPRGALLASGLRRSDGHQGRRPGGP